MAVGEAYPQRAMRDDLGEGVVVGLDIEVALDYLQVRRYRAEEIPGLAIGEVAETQYLTDLPWREELLELRG